MELDFLINDLWFLKLLPVGAGTQLPPIPPFVLALGKSLLHGLHSGVKARVGLAEYVLRRFEVGSS